jgi:co-chaperonin GroES (HSP10)
MKIKMTNDNVLVEFEKSKVLDNKVIMDKNSAGRKELVFATVVKQSLGRDMKGKRVCFPFYAASRVMLDDKEYFVVSEQDIVMYEDD